MDRKQPLVLVHGWGVNHGVWQQLTPLLADVFEVSTPDLPGFGLAVDTVPSPYQLTTVARQMAAEIPAGAIVVGWSLGGLVATQIALDFPDKVAVLGWVASSPCFLQQSDWPGMKRQVLEQFAVVLSQNLPLTVERFLAIQAMGSETARQDIKALKQAVLALPLPAESVLQATLAMLAATDLRGQLAKLPMPIAACFGQLDSLIPISMVPVLQQYRTQLELTILPKASHAPFISHPKEFVDWIHSLTKYLSNDAISV